MTRGMIKPLTKADINAVWEITYSVEYYKPWTRQSLLQEIEAAPSLGFWDQDQLQAFVLYRELPDQFEITWLATHRDHLRQGKMTELFNAIINASRHGLSRKTEIWLEVHEDNVKAQKLYEKLGFVKAGVRARYYDHTKAAILYTKSL